MSKSSFQSRLNRVKLEETCNDCDGAGGHWQSFVSDPPEWQYCPTCNGSGYTLTQFGRKVFRLMKHNFKPMFNKAKQDEE